MIFEMTSIYTRWNDSMFFSINLYITDLNSLFFVFFLFFDSVGCQHVAHMSIKEYFKNFKTFSIRKCTILFIFDDHDCCGHFFFQSPFHGPLAAHYIKNFLKRPKHRNCWHSFVYIRIETRTMIFLNKSKTLIFQIVKQIRIRHSKNKTKMNIIFCKILIWNIHQGKNEQFIYQNAFKYFKNVIFSVFDAVFDSEYFDFIFEISKAWTKWNIIMKKMPNCPNESISIIQKSSRNRLTEVIKRVAHLIMPKTNLIIALNIRFDDRMISIFLSICLIIMNYVYILNIQDTHETRRK